MDNNMALGNTEGGVMLSVVLNTPLSQMCQGAPEAG